MSSGLKRTLAFAPLKLVLSLLAISLVTFLATNAIPGETTRSILGRQATPEQIEQFRQQQGLDKPVVERYGIWLSNVLTGDWGNSIASGQPVWETIKPRLERSTILALIGFSLAVPASLLIGLLAGRRSGGVFDGVTTSGTLLVAALPEFIVGIALLALVAVELGWLPVDSTDVSLTGISVGEKAAAFALPALAIAITNAPYLIRMARANTREVVSEPYMRAAVLRGLPSRSLTFKHLLPNATPPVVNSTAILLGSLIGGVVAIEAVFAFPGVGQLLVSSVQIKDIAVVQALTLIIGGAFVTINIMADIVVTLTTPRLRASTS